VTAHVHLDDLDRIGVGALTWRPVRERLGATGFGVNAWTGDAAGDEVIESHTEGTAGAPGHQELYLVVAGRATFTVGDEEIDAPVGTFVHAEPGTKRGAVATEPNTTVLAMGAKPGVPHEISKWEEIFVAFGHYRSGDETAAREHLSAFVAENDDEWQGHYNLACLEALTKNREGAISELKRAIELDPKAKEYAAKDEDFDWLRDDPEFPA
jgi:hypothetical protein